MAYCHTTGKLRTNDLILLATWNIKRLHANLLMCRNQAEMTHTCRGSISLHGAIISTEDTCNLIVSNSGTQTFHLKALSEVERQRHVHIPNEPVIPNWCILTELFFSNADGWLHWNWQRQKQFEPWSRRRRKSLKKSVPLQTFKKFKMFSECCRPN